MRAEGWKGVRRLETDGRKPVIGLLSSAGPRAESGSTNRSGPACVAEGISHLCFLVYRPQAQGPQNHRRAPTEGTKPGSVQEEKLGHLPAHT